MSTRVERLQAALEEPLLVMNAKNVLYLTGLSSSNVALLVEPEGTPKLFTDFRYAARARAIEGIEFTETKRAVVTDLAERLSGRFGFEAADVSYDSWEKLKQGGLELVPRTGLVEKLRAVKDEQELDAMRRAAAISDRAYERIAQERWSGRTERELAWRFDVLLREEGGEGAAFPTIVAAGANGANPHAIPRDVAVEAGQLVVLDAGCVVDDYCSDCTRTFAVGEVNGRLRNAYDVCLRAQLAGLEAMRAGTTGKQADAAAREVIEASEFKGTFGHGLGHGVGLLVHEAPTARTESADTLEAGNVISCEPGIYLEGLGGIRIEDLVHVTDGEPEILMRFTKELVTVE